MNNKPLIKLFENFNENDLIFKPVRKTQSGSRIIDVNENILYQTCWLKMVNDIEYSICVDPEKIQTILQKIDEIVINHASNAFGFERHEIIKMYRPLLKLSGNNKYFSMSILTNTALFDKHKNFYNKSEIKNILKQGHYVRFIFNFKKIYFKDHELTFPLELQQIELA